MSQTFILDIGTRVVVGLIMKKKEEGYEILASATTEHTERAMYDGQVHNVEEVASAVKRVKIELERKIGTSLERVAVAAAGRALKTQIAQSERIDIAPSRWEREDILALELEAVEIALKEINLANDEYETSYHCVGYSTVEQWLDDQSISSLIGQRGRKARVVVIATFLPRSVIDGLLAVLDRVGLLMESLTLEPIAAGLAAIPPNMRRMNLALVDIGAGTADIALTHNGSFFAYGMVPMAGDEVTEVICNHFLLDFQTGERVKRALNSKTTVTFKNFFGEKITVSKEAIIEVMRPVTSKICDQIAREILRLNTSLPQGVILIGGGSLTPGLADMLAEILGLTRSRVGIQVRERISQVSGENSLKGPDNITPIGIGISTIEQKGLHYYTVKVNGVSIPIFELQLATVAEALLAAGIQPRSFIGRPGSALTFELNGRVEVIKGDLGEPSHLSVNGITARLDQKVKPNDIINFVPGQDGKDASARINDFIQPLSNKEIWWNGESITFSPILEVKGQKAQWEDQIPDASTITFLPNHTLKDLLIQKGLNLNSKSITTSVNGKVHILWTEVKILVNGITIREDCPLKSGDRVEYEEQALQVKDLAIEADPLQFMVNGEQVSFPPQQSKFFYRGLELTPETVITDGMVLRIEGFSRMPILSELLPYTKVKDNIPTGSRLRMRVNGQEAQFTTLLHPGAQIEIEWIPIKMEFNK